MSVYSGLAGHLGYYGMSITGRSHRAKRQRCQDYSKVRAVGPGWIAAAVADGLGSAKRSETGARIAVRTTLNFLKRCAPDRWHEDDLKALLRVAYLEAERAIRKEAAKRGAELPDYDTTLTTAVYNGVNVVYGHVGDGGIITLSRYGDFDKLTAPQKGEAWNVTNPLRSGSNHWEFGAAPDSVCALLLMTDGIYDIACPPQLANSETPIWVSRIRRFIDINCFAAKSEDDFKKIKTETRKFFAGKDSKLITDDKTIVAVINTEETPDKKDYTEPDWEALKTAQYNALYGGQV